MIHKVFILLLVSTCLLQGYSKSIDVKESIKINDTTKESNVSNITSNSTSNNVFSINNTNTSNSQVNKEDDIDTDMSISVDENVKDIPDLTDVNKPAVNSSSNSTIVIKTDVKKKQNTGFENTSSIFNRLLDYFDRQTLILIVAFLIGLILIGLIIALSFCIFQSCGYKSSNKKNKSDKQASDLATNPAYDDAKYVPNFDADDLIKNDLPDNDSYPCNIPLLSNKANTQTPSKSGKNKDSLLNSTSSLTCSTASVNSVIYNKTPNSIKIIKSPDTVTSSDSKNKINSNETNTPKTGKTEKNSSALNLRSSISNIVANTFSSTPSKSVKKGEEKGNDSENERSCLLDETDNTEVPNDSIVRRPIFQPQVKSAQQILREQKISKHPSYSRTQSESHSDEPQKISSTVSNNRLSAASSRSSIAMPGIPLNFDQIKDDIEDLALNKEKLVSRTNLHSNSQNGSQIIDADSHSDSVNNSIADIYIKELINKHQESNRKDPKKKMFKTDVSVSSSSIASAAKREALKKKRLSMNVDISEVNFNTNPNGRSSTNLDKNASASVYTVSSEKSCY